MKILLLEDDYTLSISIEEFLVDIGHEVKVFSNGIDAQDSIYENSYDIAVLDVKVPGLDGFELLKELRNDKNDIPVIFMTSFAEIESMEEGYRIGCCDYIRKPFDLKELELRLSQAYKSFYFNHSSEIKLTDDLTYDTENSTLYYKKEKIVLSKIEQEIFNVLLKHQNQIVTFAMFQDEIWGSFVNPANIRVQVNNLRRRLPDGIIKNRRGLGYIFER